MWPDRVSNPRPLTYKLGALPTALHSLAGVMELCKTTIACLVGLLPFYAVDLVHYCPKAGGFEQIVHSGLSKILLVIVLTDAHKSMKYSQTCPKGFTVFRGHLSLAATFPGSLEPKYSAN